MTDDPLTRSSSSKLRESIKTFGTNSYYYAHSRKIDIPADAIRVEGDGLVTGGTPVLLKVGDTSDLGRPVTKRLTAYSWTDAESSVKIYIEDAEWLQNASERPVETEFNDTSFSIRVTGANGVVTTFSVDNLDDEVEPSDCTYRLSPGKRFTLTLKKRKANKTWYSLKK